MITYVSADYILKETTRSTTLNTLKRKKNKILT